MTILRAVSRFLKSKRVQLACATVALIMVPLAHGGKIGIGGEPVPPWPTPIATGGVKHVTDGGFNLPNGPQTSDGPEWSGPNVVKDFFPVAPDGSGGAYLYVEQGSGNQAGTLFLMYDYVNGTANNANTFFDVFFQDRPANTDYGIRIQGNSFTAYEKAFGPPSPLSADGSFDFGGAPWTPVTAADLNLANFHGAIGFGTSPNLVANHLMAEFDLTINSGVAGQPNGIYDPAPAFWSASCKNCGPVDPPITSGIFVLNPDGSTTVTPVLGPSGGPQQQPNETPEPATVWLMVPALGFVLLRRSVVTR